VNVLLIDHSSIIHPLYHMSATEPDPDWTAHQAVARVHALATGQDAVAVCCEGRGSFRKQLDPTYKANRPEQDGVLAHQIATSIETLANDGFTIWRAEGCEADDIIASATRAVLAQHPDAQIVIASADKDLLQLVAAPAITVKSLRDGSVIDDEAVTTKFNVHPNQILDYLCLVGDNSDNVKGANGIGPKRAADLLGKFGTLAALYEAVGKNETGLSVTLYQALLDFLPRVDTVRSLLSLKDDIPLPIDDLFKPRPIPEMTDMEPTPTTVAADAAPLSATLQAEIDESIAQAMVTAQEKPLNARHHGPLVEGSPLGDLRVYTGPDPDVLEPAPVEWERQLDPRSLSDAKKLAMDMFQSRMFAAYGTPQGVLATVLAARELGLPAMAGLRAFHIIEGKPYLSADMIRAMVIKSGQAKYFRCTERTATRATFETQRGDDPPISLSFTVEEGRAAFVGDDKKFAGSGWGKNPADMCVARASSKLARLVYPDIGLYGLYAPEEIENG
jgi:5'-3' exonuclease